ncbi:MAG: HEAT repeat domain-containing protein [Deltaproteobacteria bacterium]|nr:HEAT repeat domain-containing protein [Deltaproteobacteria bacterium]
MFFRNVFYVFCALLLMFASSSCVLILPFMELENGSASSEEACLVDAEPEILRIAKPKLNKAINRDAVLIAKYMKELHDKDAAVRTRAASSLGSLGAKAKKAVPLLIASLDDESKHVRRASAKSLGKIHSPEAVSPLIRTLRDRDWFVAHSAANALKNFNTSQARRALVAYRSKNP